MWHPRMHVHVHVSLHVHMHQCVHVCHLHVHQCVHVCHHCMHVRSDCSCVVLSEGGLVEEGEKGWQRGGRGC